jgi:hypothetical protein
MKPHPDLDWIKKALADLERHRGDPQIDAFMSELAETLCRLGLIPKPIVIRDAAWPARNPDREEFKVGAEVMMTIDSVVDKSTNDGRKCTSVTRAAEKATFSPQVLDQDDRLTSMSFRIACGRRSAR